MKRFIVYSVILTLVVYFALPYFVDGIFVQGWLPALFAGVSFAIINLMIKPILRIITLPFNILSLGLFGLFLNILLFWLVAHFVSGFNLAGFMPAFWGALIITLAHIIFGRVGQQD